MDGVYGWTIMKSSMDDDQKWMIQLSIQWTDERATLGKIQHVGAVDKSMTIALNSSEQLISISSF